MTRPGWLASCALLVAALTGPPGGTALAVTDYDPRSASWNGTRELARIAEDAGVDLRPGQALDWDQIQRGQGLLVMYPLDTLGLNDLSSFLEEGGRVAWLDDFGTSQPFLDWFQFHRETRVVGVPRADDLPELLLARPRGVHALSDGVDVLVTNIPTALSHPHLDPVFEFVRPRGSLAPDQGLVLVGQIGRGRLVVGGDPSVLLNTMMRFPGNRRFAQNLVSFLATRPGGRVTVVWGDVRVRGMYRGRTRHNQGRARIAVNTLNEAMASLSQTLAATAFLRPLAMLLALGVACALGVVTWGRRPSERYGPRGPDGVAAGVTDRVALFGNRKANMLFPAMLARRHLEHGLLRAVGVRPPTDVHKVLDRAAERLTEAQRAEVRGLLVELDALAVGADEGRAARVSATRFLSLWQRIDAILTAIGGTG